MADKVKDDPMPEAKPMTVEDLIAILENCKSWAPITFWHEELGEISICGVQLAMDDSEVYLTAGNAELSGPTDDDEDGEWVAESPDERTARIQAALDEYNSRRQGAANLCLLEEDDELGANVAEVA